MTTLQLVSRYAFFALIATMTNLLAQRVILGFGDRTGILITALLSGTIAGLFVKYILDKRWIFTGAGAASVLDTREFLLYICMGLLTTIIFWATEMLFWLIWSTHSMREIGAIIGLSVGYSIKYRLDKKFVFKK